MNEETNTPRTMATLKDGDSFTFSPADVNRCTVVVQDDGARYYRGAYGQSHPFGPNESQVVYNVKTEAECDAEYQARRDMEIAEERARAADFAKLMRSVAKVLGLKYEVTGGEDSDRRMMCRMKGKDGVELWAAGSSWHRKTGRICISGLLPREGGQNGCNEITVSDTKTPEQIAADVKRRVMPEYMEKLAKANEAIDSANAYQALTHATCDALIKATFGQRHKDNVYGPGIPSMDVSGDKIAFKVYSVSLPCMLELLKVLKRHKAE